jgi:ABC-type transporter lipoprotein component MlaA
MKKASIWMILLKIMPGLRIRLSFLAALACLITESTPAQPITPTVRNEPTQVIGASVAGDSIILPTGLNDPIEPFNRAIWGFNKGFMTWVVKPGSKGYRRVALKPVRTGIGNMGKNLTFPDRLLNNLSQGKWAGMGQETERCICNTVTREILSSR